MYQIRPINNHIVVRFDEKPETPAGLAIPERYLIQEGDAMQSSAYGVTTDRRLINPQTCTIVKGKGAPRRCFVYYGAYEVAQWLEDEMGIIPEKTVFFYIDPIEMMPGTYLCEEIFSEDEKTSSGIILKEGVREPVMLRLVHLPTQSSFKPGDVVISIDGWQYPLTHEGKRYIKLREEEIIGIKTDDGYQALGSNIHIRYCHDPEEESRQAQRAKNDDILRMARRHGMRLSQQDVTDLSSPIPEPRHIEAEIIATGERIMVNRNYGCLLPDGTWIINKDTLLLTISVKSDAINL